MSIYNDTPSDNKFPTSLHDVGSVTEQLASLIDFNDNIIFLNNEIDELALAHFILKVRMLDQQNSPEFINVVINSEGGLVHDALGIIDFMESSDIKFNTICRGRAWSAAALILASGTGSRLASKRASIMFHDSLHSHDWITTRSLLSVTDHSEKFANVMYDILAQRTNKEAVWWKDKMQSDFWLTANEALELNIIDQII
jgi:ATP-dependent Clp protease protease subunit